MDSQVDTLAEWYARALNEIKVLRDALESIEEHSDDEVARLVAYEALRDAAWSGLEKENG
jgi:hypothetical protein